MNEAFGYLNAADGILQTQVDLVQRMRELAIQSANGTLSLADRSTIQVELNQLMEEFNRLGSDSSFNGVNLLDGSFEAVKLQVGVNKGQTVDLDIGSSRPEEIFTEDVTTSTRQFASNFVSTLSGFSNSYQLADLNGDGADDVVENDFSSASVYINDGSGSFGSGETLSIVNQGVNVADFNNDGNDDLIFVNGSTRIVKLSDGRGSFSSTITTNLTASQTVLSTIADFNNDGYMDILNGGAVSTDPYSLNLGTGTGGFSAATTTISGANVLGAQVIDLNKDGYLDVVFNASTGTERFIRMGSSSGTFSQGATISSVGTATDSENIVDMNRDGVLDFVYRLSTTANLATVTLLNSSGGVISTTSYGAALAGYNNVKTGDIDGDGDLDAVFSNGAGSAARLMNGPNTVTTFSVGASAAVVGVEDFNNDGIADIISRSSTNLYQYRGSSAGSFTAVATLSWVDTFATIEDIDGDGFLDVWGSETNTGEIFTAWNSSGLIAGSAINTGLVFASYTPLLGDLNSDGFKDFYLYEATGSGSSLTKIQGTVTNAESATVDLSSLDSAEDSLQILDNAIENLSARRANIGALQNRLESAVNANALTRENMLGAYSQIIDADIADETAELVRTQIQQQAATSVLGQANVSLRMALDLIRS